MRSGGGTGRHNRLKICRLWRGGSTPPPSTKFIMNQIQYISELEKRIEDLEISRDVTKDRLTALENPSSVMDNEYILDPLTESKKILTECRNLVRKIRETHTEIKLVKAEIEADNREVIKILVEFRDYFNMPKRLNFRTEPKGGETFAEDIDFFIRRRDVLFDTNQSEDSGKTQ